MSPGGRIEPSMSIGKCIGNKNDTFNVYTCARAEDKKAGCVWGRSCGGARSRGRALTARSPANEVRIVRFLITVPN